MNDFSPHQTALETLKTNLVAELNTIAVYNEATGDWEVTTDHEVTPETDTNSLADSGEDANERSATLTQLETRYRNVVRALAKIEAGTYGICEVSGEPIEARRLEANPAARTCQAHMENEYDLPL